MKGKYITWDTLFAVKSKPAPKRDIHAELAVTIAERTRIMKQMEDFSKKAKVIDTYLDTNKAA